MVYLAAACRAVKTALFNEFDERGRYADHRADSYGPELAAYRNGKLLIQQIDPAENLARRVCLACFRKPGETQQLPAARLSTA